MVERGQGTAERAVKLVLSDADLKFDSLRDHKQRYFRPEDLKFASMLQPTTSGNCVYCSYELHVTRKIGGLWYKYTDLPGIQVEVTINPSPAQVSTGVEPIKPPGFWGPIFIDCEDMVLEIERPLN